MLTNQHFSYYSTVMLKNQEESRYFYKTDENGGVAAVNAGKSFLRSLRGNVRFRYIGLSPFTILDGP